MQLTVFTPTYNRAYLLPRLYESLCRQTDRSFVWLIIDDGSIDNTGELVQGWINDNLIDIRYHYKANGGMHTGHNAAYRLIDTELNVCIDSDDYMPDNAIELILNAWDVVDDQSAVAGLIGLDALENGTLIGTRIPEDLKQGGLTELYQVHKVRGDKKLVLRTDVVRQYPTYPEYSDERLVPLDVLYAMIGEDYDFRYVNEVFCIVEYQEEGSTKTIFRQYRQSPRGFAYARKINIKYAKSLKGIIKSYIHLISSSFFAKDLSLAFKGVNPLLTVLLYPFGIILNIYIMTKIKR